MFVLFQKYERGTEEAQDYHPHGVLSFLAQTQDLSELERLARYKKELLNVAGIKPNDLNVLFMLAQVNFRLGETHDGLTTLDRIVALAPADSSVRIRMAALQQTFGLYSQAAEQLNRFLERNDTADVRIALATLYGYMGRTNDAIEILKQKILDSDQTAPYHYLFGRLLIQKGDLAFALQQFERAAALDHDRVEYPSYAGICAAKIGQSGEAAKWLIAAKKKGHNNAMALYADGMSLILEGRSTPASASFQKAIEVSFDWEPPWLALAYALRDSADEVEKVLNQTESLFPNSPWPHLLKAKLLNSDLEVERALKLAPCDPRTYEQLLALAVRHGKSDQVKELCQRMADLGIDKASGNAESCVDKSRDRPSAGADADSQFLIAMLADSAAEGQLFASPSHTEMLAQLK
jgi:tetratricopeptide (TPR) repeat protein